jgi:hypothetical protein
MLPLPLGASQAPPFDAAQVHVQPDRLAGNVSATETDDTLLPGGLVAWIV